MFAWGITGTIGAAVAPLQARVAPRLAGAAEWLSRHRDLGPRYLAANTTPNAADMLRSYSLTAILGLAAIGYIQAANTLMGPFKIILFGIGLITIPEAVRLRSRSPQRLPLFCVAVSVGFTLLALVWGVALLVALPRGLGHLMLGSIWRGAYPLVLPATLALIGTCIGSGAGMGLTGLGAARRNLRAVILNSALLLSFGLVGAVTGGTLGTMRWYAAASWITALVSWWQLRRALLESGNVPVPRWLWPRRPAGGRRGSAAANSGASTTREEGLRKDAELAVLPARSRRALCVRSLFVVSPRR